MITEKQLSQVGLKNGLKYYESELSQDEQKHTGWYWCSDRMAYYRWDGLMGIKDE